jgi:hypothetical protein
MDFEKIADWSQADLRRFVVNLLLSDPGALPKPPAHDATKDLPVSASDGDIPVWDKASQRWVSSTQHPAPGTDLANASTPASKLVGYPADATKMLKGDGSWSQFGGIRIAAGEFSAGVFADAWYRLYAATPTVYVDDDSMIATYNNGYLNIPTTGFYIGIATAVGPSGSPNAGWRWNHNSGNLYTGSGGYQFLAGNDGHPIYTTYTIARNFNAGENLNPAGGYSTGGGTWVWRFLIMRLR